jgi:hypothetical protein
MSPTSRMRKRECNFFLVYFHSPTRIELCLINQIFWRTLYRNPSVFMVTLSISKILERNGRGRTIVDSRRRYSNHFHVRIQKKVQNRVSEGEVCIDRIFHLIFEIDQQRKQ